MWIRYVPVPVPVIMLLYMDPDSSGFSPPNEKFSFDFVNMT